MSMSSRSKTTLCPSKLATSPAKVIATIQGESNRTRPEDGTESIALDEEQACEVSPEPGKRKSNTHGETPESKRLKLSPTPPANGNTNHPTQQSSESADLPGNITKDTWQGFCEIESEPAFFNAILQDMGIESINVREIFSMLPDYLETLQRPIYGLILLYSYRSQGSSDTPEHKSDHVWFANQLPAQNSCATLAMINIVMNSTEIEIGEHLRQFKDFTKDFTPYQRGEAFASFDFVKKIHNSFAKNMDILEADKHLSYKIKRSQIKQKDKKGRRKSGDSAATDDSAEGHEENAHHFIAYIPVGNEIWMLDGLNAQPINVGTFNAEQGDDWVLSAADSILAVLASGGDDYTGFAIMPSTLPELRRQACRTTNHMKSLESQLDATSPDWRSFVTDSDSPHTDPAVLGIEDQLQTYPTPSNVIATIASEGLEDLLKRRTKLLKDLNHFSTSIISEMQDEADSARKATQARFDHGPVIKLWAEMLAENGYLEQNLDRFIGPRGGSKKGNK
ncbi:hypothetical protein E8E13_006957 [Curvularia kusanoi]|uniref:ubiquitinyl hydrolase 1 n=1 Tax=Curvularia kusanoi TaxID=90978 RepID=A0A9P4WD80_CURKU|nr:hypothetical protein E8E13_006957 [Curvularia kusanoi]